MKKFSNKSPVELTRQNMDRSCALCNCPDCDFNFRDDNHYWFKRVEIVAICEAPWVGGTFEKRPLAIVYQCPKCFEYFWFHTIESHKDTLEDLLNEGMI